jgi:SAM-dependent methyltransferase
MGVVQTLYATWRAVRGTPQPGSEEAYWDEWVRRVRACGQDAGQPYIGTEWGHEEGFLSTLRKYADPTRRALEIGCGGGRITAMAAALFAHVDAADVSQEMVRACASAVTAKNVSFHKLDGVTLKEFGNDTVDCVYAHDVFVQLASVEVYPYLMEMLRVLRPGGIAVASFYDFVTRFELFKTHTLRDWAARRSARRRRLHFVTEEMIDLMLRDLGAEIVDAQKTASFFIVVFRKAAAARNGHSRNGTA